MKAVVGAKIVVHHGYAAEAEDTAEVLEVRGCNGEPPYVVRWAGARRPSLYFPGPDAHVAETSGS